MTGKYILTTGEITECLTDYETALGVIYNEDRDGYWFLSFADTDCRGVYSLDGILDIARGYNLAHGGDCLRWSVPSLCDWNLILRNLARVDITERNELSAFDRMTEWTEFHCATTVARLKEYNLRPDTFYWSSTEGYDDDVYLLYLNGGTIEPYPVWDDGEEYDYALRLVGYVVKEYPASRLRKVDDGFS